MYTYCTAYYVHLSMVGPAKLTDASTHSRERLTRERIVEAALRIVDSEGLPALNMRRLGEDLQVRAMALYKHFPNKSAILDGAVESMLGGLAEATSGEDWREGFRATFLSLRALLGGAPECSAARRLAPPRLSAAQEAPGVDS